MTARSFPSDLGDPPIEHRLLGMDRRLMGPTLGILALVIFWAGIIPAIDEAVEADALDPTEALTVAGAVEFFPAEGWVSDGVPSPTNAEITLFKDGVTFTVSPGAWEGDANELLDELIDEEEPITSGDRLPFTLPSGVEGVGIDATFVDERGFLAAAVSQEPFIPDDPRITGIRIESSSPVEYSPEDQEDVAQMLASLRVIPFDERGPAAEDEEDGE